MTAPLHPLPTRELPPGRLDQRAEHLLAEINQPRRGTPRLRARPVARPLLVAAVVAAAIATPALAFRNQLVDLFTTTHPIVRPATVASLPTGWQQFTQTPYLLTRQGATAQTIITSWHWRPSSGLGPGNSIPANGIMISIELLRTRPSRAAINLCDTTPHLRGYPQRELPLRLPATTTSTFEGAPRVPEYRIFGRQDDSYNYEIRVDVNNPHPTKQTLAIAQRVVSSIKFPTWPAPKSC